MSTEKALSESIVPSVTATIALSLHEVAWEIQLRSLNAFNIIIQGLPEFSKSLVLKKISEDKNIVSNIFNKLDPPVSVTSITKAFRIDKSANNNPRMLKLVFCGWICYSCIFESIHRTSSSEFLSLVTVSTLSRNLFARSTKNYVLDREEGNPISPSGTLMGSQRLFFLSPIQKTEVAINKR